MMKPVGQYDRWHGPRDLAPRPAEPAPDAGRRSTPSPEAGTTAPPTARSAPPWPGLTPPSAEDVAAVVENLLADDGWVDSLVDGPRRGAAPPIPISSRPFAHLNSDIHNGLVVYEDDHVSIAAGVSQRRTSSPPRRTASAARRSIAFSGQLTIFKFVRAGGARLSFWEAPPITDGFTAATAGRCARTGDRQLRRRRHRRRRRPPARLRHRACRRATSSSCRPR